MSNNLTSVYRTIYVFLLRIILRFKTHRVKRKLRVDANVFR